MTFYEILIGSILFFIVALSLYISLYRGNDERR